jgi:hypothetical protein
MENPLDPGTWVKAIFDFFLSTFTTGAEQSMINAMERLMQASWPTFTGTFMSVWSSTFGLSLLISLFVLAVNAVLTAFNYREDGWIVALKNVGWVMLNGTVMVAVVWSATFVVDFANRAITDLTKSIIGTDVWYGPFQDLLGTDILSQLGLAWLGLIVGQALDNGASLLNLALMFYMLLYLIASRLGTGLISQIVRSFLTAALYTTLTARVFQILVLALGAITLNIMGSTSRPTPEMATMIIFVGIIAVMVPHVMLIIIFISRLVRERRLDPSVIEKERETKVVSEENRQEVANNRAQNLLAGSKSEASEFASSALRSAGHAATALGFAKAAAFTTAKLTGAIPEGSSKLITVAAAAIGFAAAYGERKAHQKVDDYADRVGRPGASRARNLSGEG